MDSLKDQAAIVGIGETVYNRESGRTELSMAVEAAVSSGSHDLHATHLNASHRLASADAQAQEQWSDASRVTPPLRTVRQSRATNAAVEI